MDETHPLSMALFVHLFVKSVIQKVIVVTQNITISVVSVTYTIC